MAERRFSITPLVEALRLDKGESVSRALGISGSTLTKYTVNGIDERTADRLASRAGFHPSNIWTDWFDVVIDELERECAAPECSERFVPPVRVPYKKYCSQRCVSRVSARRRYAEDAARREERKAAARRYYEEAREYRKSQIRRWQEENREQVNARRRQRWADRKAA